MKIKVSQITSNRYKDHYKINIKGYNNKNEVVRFKKDFIDYFYYPKEHIADLYNIDNLVIDEDHEYIGFDDVITYKVIYRDYKTKRDLESDNTIKYRLYGSDIDPEKKYIFDTGIEWSEDRHIIYYDIETDYDENNPTLNSPEIAEMPITAITLYSTFKSKYYVFSWHPDVKPNKPISIENQDNIQYIFCRDEEYLLQSFIAYMKKLDPDVISGWFSSGFDLPYIINRCSNIGIDYRLLSPDRYVNCYKKEEVEYGKQEWYTTIKGLDHIDMLEALKQMGFKLSNYKLDTAAKEILKDKDMEKLKSVTWRDWKDDYAGFLKYSIRDVEILKEIDEKVNIMKIFISVQQITNITQLIKMLSKVDMIESFVFTKNWNKFTFKNTHPGVRLSYKGAIVIDPVIPGLHKNVALCDYASLYPTTIMALNISPETYIISHDEAINENIDIDGKLIPNFTKQNIKYVDTGYNEELIGNRYLFLAHETKQGIFPVLLRDLYKARVETKKEMNTYSRKSSGYRALNVKQNVYKTILNSTYGCFANPYFRFFKPEVADAITYFARQFIMFAMDYFKVVKNIITNYSDTDSVFLLTEDYDLSKMESDLQEYNKALKSLITTKFNTGFNDDFWFMNLEHEKTLDYIYFGLRKKRYYSIDTDGEEYVKGINIIRKDTPNFIKTRLSYLCKKIVKGTITLKDLEDTKKQIESVDYVDLGIHKKFGKRFDEYVKTQPQHIKAARYANTTFDLNITHIDVPLMFYIKTLNQDDIPKAKRDAAICLLEENVNIIDNQNEFIIDYGTYMDKQVISPLEEFDIIISFKKLLNEYKLNHPEFYKFKTGKNLCPICGKRHMKASSAEECYIRSKKINELPEEMEKYYRILQGKELYKMHSSDNQKILKTEFEQINESGDENDLYLWIYNNKMLTEE
jgi:DNA polymerase elongation subunit (family B)